ncbi:MAG: MerR family transcriptional regulator [Desulfamplus sp.]|nr:MerR family transcriptional regulator [Desulfamplus sp.]
MMTEETYGISSICELVNRSAAQIRWWEQQGFIPIITDRISAGKRAYRRYSATDLEMIRTFVGYLDQGLVVLNM